MAGSVVMSLPIILLFFLAERFLTEGLTTGGVKGSYVDLQDVASATWLVSGRLVSTGVEATPFS